jgi:hypothetical protein
LWRPVLIPNPSGERVCDELFAKASAHYDDTALWTLTMAIGQICFFIPVALIARPIPGKPIGKNYNKVAHPGFPWVAVDWANRARSDVTPPIPLRRLAGAGHRPARKPGPMDRRGSGVQGGPNGPSRSDAKRP